MKSVKSGKNIEFSVIVPAFNSGRTLPLCLEALERQDLDRGRFEIIVVDDGSTDNTSELVQRFDVRYVFQDNRGPASARNAGVDVASGQIVLFTDADCMPCPDWVEEMVRPFSDAGIVAVKGRYRTRQTELVARFVQMEFEDRYDMLQKHEAIDMIDTYSAAFRKDVFQRMGGFDTRFPKANNEDTELSYRLASAGCKMVFNPKAVVFHTHPATLAKYLKIKFWRGYWRMVVYRKYPHKAFKDTYTPNVLKLQTILMALSFPVCLLSIGDSRILPWLVSIWGVVWMSALPFSLKTYRKDKAAGLASPWIILLRSMVFAAGSLLGLLKSLIQPLK